MVAAAAIDNLVKGAAGQAVQCANLAIGLPETAGSTSSPRAVTGMAGAGLPAGAGAPVRRWSGSTGGS